MKKNVYWHKIDNAGKLFPAISRENRSNVFRLSFYLVDDVQPSILEKAVNEVLPRFEAFAVKMKTGLFWNYLCSNHAHFVVEKERFHVCKLIYPLKNNGYLFKVYYFNNKITLEMFHAVSDGTGASEFLKAIVYRYLKHLGKDFDHEYKILSEIPKSPKENEDMFNYLYDKLQVTPLKEEAAYWLNGYEYRNEFSLLIKMQFSTPQIKAIAKSKNATLTQYLAALVCYSIYMEQMNVKFSKKPIKAFIPVNLRNYFESTTLRNFSLYIKLTFPCLGHTWTFESMLEETIQQFHDQLQQEKLFKRMNSNVGFEKNLLIKILPLFLKNIAFKIGYFLLGENINTFSLSNLGKINFPNAMLNEVKDVDFVNGGRGLAVTMASIDEFSNVYFNTTFKDLSIPTFVMKHFVNQGIPITVDTNYKEEYDEIL